MLKTLAHDIGDVFFDQGVLLLGPPIRDLWESLFAEMLVKNLVISAIRREKGGEVLDTAALEYSSERLH